MLLAIGGTGGNGTTTGLGRALSVGEADNVSGVPGATSADTIIFATPAFPIPPASPSAIVIGSQLPALTSGNDTIDATSPPRSVLVQGAENRNFHCLVIDSSNNAIKGLQLTDCSAAIRVISGTGNLVGSAGAGNTIYDSGSGVALNIGASGNVVKANRIGTDPAGSTIPAEGGNDIGVVVESNGNLIGGAAAGERNVISGNIDGLVLMRGSSNVIRGNFIGTDITGALDRGNNVGINLSRFGTPTGPSSNTIGGLAPGQANLISGNTAANVFIADPDTTSNSLVGNMIGPDLAGNNAAAMTNGDGIRVTAGAHDNIIGPRNTISDNVRGVEITGSSTNANVLRGNFIGTNSAGGSIGNSVGIYVSGSSGNQLGGTAPGDGNVIAFNSATGVVITGAGVANPIRGNSLYNNTAEIDTNQGGNTELLAPVLTSTLFGTVSGFACADCTVDIFSDASTDARFYEGTTLAASDGAFTFSNDAPFVETNITAINTDAGGNSSELSLFLAIDSDGDGANDATDSDDDSDGMPDESDACRVFPEDYDGHDDADGCPDPDNDADGVCDSGLTSPSCLGSDTGKTAFFGAGHNHTNPTIDCRNMPEDFDAFRDADGCPEPDNDNDGFPDGTDQCPGDDNVAGADGVLGSGEDQNHNGILNGGEDTVVVDGVLTTDDVVLTFEDYDLVLNTDGCHDSPGQDRDGDGYTDEVEELHLRTKGDDPCGTDAWPSDISAAGVSANRFDIIDLGTFVAPIRRLNASPGQPGFDVRWDLRPGPITPPGTGPHINTQDLATTVTGASGFPPMFGGQKALNRSCVVSP